MAKSSKEKKPEKIEIPFEEAVKRLLATPPPSKKKQAKENNASKIDR